MKCLLFVLASFAVAQCARVALEPRQRVEPPAGWKTVGSADPNAAIVLTFAIKLRNLDVLEKTFWAVSDPKSESYGHHLSMEAVDALVAPAAEAETAVQQWLAKNGVNTNGCRAPQGRGFLVCPMTVQVASSLLDVSFLAMSNPKWRHPVLRADRTYTVPEDVAAHLDFVGNVHRFPSLRGPILQQPSGPAPIIGVTPNVIRGRYNLTTADIARVDSNSQAVASFLDQFFSQDDVKEFFKQFGNRFHHRDQIDKIVGPDPAVAGTEAALDTEYIMTTGANVTTWFWSTPGKREGQEPFLDWIIAVGNTSNAPAVHSVSYGDDEDSLDVPYMTRLNTEFQKLGVRGISILFASGDDGAGCDSGNTKFIPNFPTSSPYVTAVGGSALAQGGRSEDGNYISGGGFSNVFSMPSYQTAAVKQFLSTSTSLPNPKYYNVSGRAYPDVAALSQGFWVVVNRIPLPGVAGTSCAAPSFSGIVAMLNDVRARSGKAPLGFLNPFLYQNGNLLFDVVKGCNAGCDQTGFCAQAGWDPVTGMGTPDYARLSKGV